MPGQLRLEPFKKEHAALLDDYGAQAWVKDYFEACLDDAEDGLAVSVWVDQVFIGCAGLAPVHDYRAIAWALFVPGYPQHFIKVHRATKAFLREHLKAFPRIEAYIDPEFTRAIRWVKSLGFREECSFKPYFFPDGRAGAEWVMLREN